MHKATFWITILILALGCAACSLPQNQSAAELPTATLAPATLTPTPIPTNTPIPPTPTFTPTATITPTATVEPTATWAVIGPGDISAPILMYHDIDPEGSAQRYNTFPEVFAQHMQALDDWGYETITPAQLALAISEGAPLPERPVIITFDDGYYNVYQYAFPIMQEHDFFGVAYIVANRLKAYGFMGQPQLAEMIEAGWDIGSHSYTHSDLTLDHNVAFSEIFYSREDITKQLDYQVTSFAYPFGSFDQYLGDRTQKWGYTNAMGLGGRWTHNSATLYYLSRIEIQGGITLEQFAALLPWSTPPESDN